VTALDAGPPVSLSLRWLGGAEPEDPRGAEGLEETAAPEDVAADAVAGMQAGGDGGAPEPLAALDDPGESPILPGPENDEEP
jgi:hypothetical protein